MPIKTNRKAVAALVAATFPGYKGRKFTVVPAVEVRFADLNWSGGTRAQYAATTLTGERCGDLDRYNTKAPWANPAEGAVAELPEGVVVVRHLISCGQDCGLTFYIRPADMPKELTN